MFLEVLDFYPIFTAQFDQTLGMFVTEMKKLITDDADMFTVIYNAIAANKADVLVAPIVEIQTDANNYLVISVTGYPATYQNYRNATPDDKWILEAEGTGKTDTNPQPSGLMSLFKKK